MHELGADAADKRRSTEEIAAKVEGAKANPNKYKTPLAELKHDEYVESKTGRGGGFWLLGKGKTLAEKRATKKP